MSSILLYTMLLLAAASTGCSDTTRDAGQSRVQPKANVVPRQAVADARAAGDRRVQPEAEADVDTEPVSSKPPRLVPRPIRLANGRRYSLNIPRGYRISVAIEGLKRVRFMAQAPDGRYFVTDMYDRTDNSRGTVYVLEGFDSVAGTFGRAVPYLGKLRNPNSITFHTDAAGASWLYLALTDRLVRYRYQAGDTAPSGEAQTLATFPAYGLSYKYGGWHLTRTVVIGGDGKLYVAVGSSCNACEEKEDVRATVLQMNPDGSDQRIFASGLRNAVGLRWVSGRLWATNMGADHLGNDRPEDLMVQVRDSANYGWPYCYEYRGRVYADTTFARSPKRVPTAVVPRSYVSLGAHSAPLGLDYFGGAADSTISNYFLVALHGSGTVSLKRGYAVVRARRGGPVRPVITGFLNGTTINGRPCDVLRVGRDAFFVTDDFAGVIYYLRPER